MRSASEKLGGAALGSEGDGYSAWASSWESSDTRVTSAEVTLVSELSQEEAQALYPSPSDPSAAPPSFSEALRTVLKQKKPR